MPRPRQTDDGLTKFPPPAAAAAPGMKQLRLWVPDRRPEFAAEAAQQGFALRGRVEEAEALEE